MKKALIFDPYLDTLGGGERYSLTFGLGLKQIGYTVEIAWPDPQILTKAGERFGLDFSSFITNSSSYFSCSKKAGLLSKILFTRQYDLIFWVSDGSLPLLFSKNNLVHFQVPFKELGGDAITNSIKSLMVNKYVYNSLFTQSVHERHLPKSKSFVLYPPIDVDNFHPSSKENIILSVARFASPSHSKRQDVLIKAFRQFHSHNSQYKLVLAGGASEDDGVIAELRSQAGDLPVEIVPNPPFKIIKDLYSRAKFFWHAAGYGINEETDPEKVEHFGIVTVEAMSAGAIPVVIAKGGQKEIITADTGYLCQNEDEIAQKTLAILNDQSKIQNMSTLAISRAKDFSQQKFYEKIKLLAAK